MTKFLHFSGNALVTPGVFLGQPQDELFGGFGLGRSAGMFWGVVESPLLPFHLAVPSQQRFRAHDGNDRGEAVPDLQAIADKRASVGFSQRHAFSQLAAQDQVLLSEEVVLLGEVFAKELLDSGDERNSRAAADRGHVQKVQEPTCRSEG